MLINIPLGLLSTVLKKPKKLVKAIFLLVKGDFKSFVKKFRDNRQIYVLKHQLGKRDWLDRIYPTTDELKEQTKVSSEFSFKPLISIITPTFNSNKTYLKECLESVLHQTYANWELCLADDCSTDEDVRKLIKKYAAKDQRIKYIFREKNGGISKASNSALDLSTGEFIGLLDHDDILLPNALFEVVSLLNSHQEADFIYSDEDKLSKDGKHHSSHFFKPDWSPDLLFSFMYTGHFTVYRRELVKKVRGFDSKFDYSQDYDLALRVSEKTKNIFHIKKILYSWRAHEDSGAGGGKPYARASNLKALESSMHRRGLKGKVKEYPFANKFEYEVDSKKGVSVVIPSDNFENCKRLIESIREKTSYKNIEILVVINSKTGEELKEFLKYEKLKIIPYNKEFNFSAKCNLGAKNAFGEYIVFLNDDMEVLSNDWVERLIEFFQRKEVGAVSPKLLYEDDTIQHAGMITGVRGLVGTAFHKSDKDSYEYFNLAQSTRNTSLLSAACLAIPKSVFEKVGGFDEINTPINHSDIDLCFRIRDQGYLLVYTPFASLRHFGHKSIGNLVGKTRDSVDKNPDIFVLNNWGSYISYDPYFPSTMVNIMNVPEVYEFEIIPGKKVDLKKAKKRILFVSHEATLSGAPLLLFWLARALVKDSYHVVFFVPNHGPLVDLLHKYGFTVFIDEQYLDKVDFLTKKFMSNFDLVLSNTINNWKIVKASEEIGTPVIWYIHESEYGIEKIKNKTEERLGIRKAFQEANITLFPSENTRNMFSKQIVIRKSRVLLTGVEINNMKRQATRDLFTILHVGSVESRKGQDLAIDAFLALPNEIREKMELKLVGRILNKKYYKKLEEKIKNHNNINLLGNLEHKDVLALYKQSDLFLCTSRDETGPITIIEAISTEIPVVTTKVGIVNEVFKDKVNVLLVEKSAESIEKAIQLIFNDKLLREKLVNNANKIFRKKFTIEVYSEKFLSILNEVLI